MSHTLRIQEVVDKYTVSLIGMDGSVFEHLIDVAMRSDAHVLLTERLNVRVDINILLIE